VSTERLSFAISLCGKYYSESQLRELCDIEIDKFKELIKAGKQISLSIYADEMSNYINPIAVYTSNPYHLSYFGIKDPGTVGERVTNQFRDIQNALAVKILAEYLTNSNVKDSPIKNGFRAKMPLNYEIYRLTNGTGHNNQKINNLDVKKDFAEGDGNNNILIRSLGSKDLPFHRIVINYQKIKSGLDSLAIEYLAIIYYNFFPELEPDIKELKDLIKKHKTNIRKRALSGRMYNHRYKVKALMALISVIDILE